MGDSSKSMKKKHVAIDMIAGSASGAISRTLTAPLDLIKIRFQVQLEPTTSSALLHKKFYGPSKYYGLLQATKDIFKEEGLPGFWRGNVPALLLYMEYAAIQFTVLRQIKTFMSGSSNKEDHKKLSPYVSFMSGALGGSAATIGSYPFDLLRTILAFQGEPKVYPNMRSAIVGVYRARGLQGLYAGLLPTLINIVPYSGCQFGFYDLFKHWIMAWKQLKQGKEEIFDDNISGIQLFMCGIAASTSAKVVCHPLDVVKKRLQVIGLERHPKYGARVEYDAFRNATRAVSQIMKKEGWAGLYKGMVPSVIKAAPAGAVTFFTYELFSKWLESVFV